MTDYCSLGQHPYNNASRPFTSRPRLPESEIFWRKGPAGGFSQHSGTSGAIAGTAAQVGRRLTPRGVETQQMPNTAARNVPQSYQHVPPRAVPNQPLPHPAQFGTPKKQRYGPAPGSIPYDHPLTARGVPQPSRAPPERYKPFAHQYNPPMGATTPPKRPFHTDPQGPILCASPQVPHGRTAPPTLRDNCGVVVSDVDPISGAVRAQFRCGPLLGIGGFAKVYEFVDCASGATYAAKVFDKAKLNNQQKLDKLQHEIEIHKRLRHRNVLAILRSFEDVRYVYILLEKCPHQTLMELSKSVPTLGVAEVKYVMTQLLCAVEYLHSVNVIHRDLKLANVLIDDALDMKVGDFGLAASMQCQDERKRTLCGTPNYIAPEVLTSGKAGHNDGYDYKADIWSLGVVLFTLFVGKPPFETADLKATYHRIQHGVYHIPAHVPLPAKRLIQRVLQVRPECRPSLLELRQDPFLHGCSADDPPPPSLLEHYARLRGIPTQLFAAEILERRKIRGQHRSSRVPLPPPLPQQQTQTESARRQLFIDPEDDPDHRNEEIQGVRHVHRTPPPATVDSEEPELAAALPTPTASPHGVYSPLQQGAPVRPVPARSGEQYLQNPTRRLQNTPSPVMGGPMEVPMEHYSPYIAISESKLRTTEHNFQTPYMGATQEGVSPSTGPASDRRPPALNHFGNVPNRPLPSPSPSPLLECATPNGASPVNYPSPQPIQFYPRVVSPLSAFSSVPGKPTLPPNPAQQWPRTSNTAAAVADDPLLYALSRINALLLDSKVPFASGPSRISVLDNWLQDNFLTLPKNAALPPPIFVADLAHFPKYGVGYRMNTGHFGALFNDKTKLISEPLTGVTEYYSRIPKANSPDTAGSAAPPFRTDVQSRFNILRDSDPLAAPHTKKIKLGKYFSSFLQQRLDAVEDAAATIRAEEAVSLTTTDAQLTQGRSPGPMLPRFLLDEESQLRMRNVSPEAAHEIDLRWGRRPISRSCVASAAIASVVRLDTQDATALCTVPCVFAFPPESAGSKMMSTKYNPHQRSDSASSSDQDSQAIEALTIHDLCGLPSPQEPAVLQHPHQHNRFHCCPTWHVKGMPPLDVLALKTALLNMVYVKQVVHVWVPARNALGGGLDRSTSPLAGIPHWALPCAEACGGVPATIIRLSNGTIQVSIYSSPSAMVFHPGAQGNAATGLAGAMLPHADQTGPSAMVVAGTILFFPDSNESSIQNGFIAGLIPCLPQSTVGRHREKASTSIVPAYLIAPVNLVLQAAMEQLHHGDVHVVEMSAGSDNSVNRHMRKSSSDSFAEATSTQMHPCEIFSRFALLATAALQSFAEGQKRT